MAFVYRFIDSDRKVIYYGKTVNLDTRIHNHFTKGHLPQECYKSVARIEYQKYKTESDALIMETYYITKYNPKYNKLGKSRDIPSIDLEEKEWKTYRVYKTYTDKANKNTMNKVGIISKILAVIYIIILMLILYTKYL